MHSNRLFYFWQHAWDFFLSINMPYEVYLSLKHCELIKASHKKFVLSDTYKFYNIALFDSFVGVFLPHLKSGIVNDHPSPLQNLVDYDLLFYQL